jgi:hypothetical protein
MFEFTASTFGPVVLLVALAFCVIGSVLVLPILLRRFHFRGSLRFVWFLFAGILMFSILLSPSVAVHEWRHPWEPGRSKIAADGPAVSLAVGGSWTDQGVRGYTYVVIPQARSLPYLATIELSDSGVSEVRSTFGLLLLPLIWGAGIALWIRVGSTVVTRTRTG